MLSWELGRLADPISDLRNGRGPLVSPRARDRCIPAMMRESVQLGVGAKAAAVLLREAKHQRPASDVVLAQARSPADVSKRRRRCTTRGGYRPKQQSDPAAWRCRNRESRRPRRTPHERNATHPSASACEGSRSLLPHAASGVGRSESSDRARREPASRRSGTGAVSGARFSRMAQVGRATVPDRGGQGRCGARCPANRAAFLRLRPYPTVWFYWF